MRLQGEAAPLPSGRARPRRARRSGLRRIGGARLAASEWTTVALVATGLAGAALRVREYLGDRSLRMDEAMLALNVIRRSPLELLEPLSFNQAAPFGFLLLSKLLGAGLGYSEHVLRATPLVAGLVSLAAFPFLARRVLDRFWSAIAFAAFALAPGVIFWSADFKPYAVDIAAAVVLAALALRALDRPGAGPLVALGAAATVAMWLSFASLFVAGAAAVALVADAVRRSDRGRLARVGAALAPWTASALVLALTIPARVESVRESSFGGSRSGDGGGGPFVSFGGIAPEEFGGALARLLGLPTGEPASLATKALALVAVVGIVALARAAWPKALVLVLPLAAVPLAAASDLYPLFERTIVFLTPAVVVLLACGAARLARLTARPAAAAALAALLLGFPLVEAARNAAEPTTPEAIKPVLSHVRHDWRPGDVLYVHYASQHVFAYYSECGCLDLTRPGPSEEPLWPVRPAPGSRRQYADAVFPASATVEIGAYPREPEDELRDLTALREPRVWFVTGGSPGVRYVTFEERLAGHGELLQAFELPTVKGHVPARALLYDLSDGRS